MKYSNVFSPAKQAICVQFGFKKFEKRLLAVFRTKMEKLLVKNQLRLKRLSLNGKQRKPRWRSLRWKHFYVARVFDQRLFAHANLCMFVWVIAWYLGINGSLHPVIKEYNLLLIRRSALNALCLVWKFSTDPLCWGSSSRILPESVIAIAFGRPKLEFPRDERRADGPSNFIGRDWLLKHKILWILYILCTLLTCS